jgi:hypothetical protein
MPSHLAVSRNSPDDVQLRQIAAMLDGESIAELMFGESVTKEIPAGHHTLRVDNTWNRQTVEFDSGEGEAVKFLVRNRAGRFSWFLLMIFGAGPIYVSIERVPAERS